MAVRAARARTDAWLPGWYPLKSESLEGLPIADPLIHARRRGAYAIRIRAAAVRGGRRLSQMQGLAGVDEPIVEHHQVDDRSSLRRLDHHGGGHGDQIVDGSLAARIGQRADHQGAKNALP
jgi:hypothetical protein